MSEPCKKCRVRVYLGIGHTCPDTACYYHVPLTSASPSRARPSDRAIALAKSWLEQNQMFWRPPYDEHAATCLAAIELMTSPEARAGDCLTGPLDPEGLIRQFQGDARLMPQTIVALARELLTTKATP